LYNGPETPPDMPHACQSAESRRRRTPDRLRPRLDRGTGTDPQTDELHAVGCTAIREEHASGADRSRPVLARLLRDITAGDTLVVVRLDRPARSVSHLLVVIEQLAAKGAYFRSLRDPIDTTTPQGMFSLQVLGAVAQLERALIAERTKAGLLVARKHGRIGGNPGLRARDPAAIRKVQNSRDKTWLDRVLAQLDTWLPTVQRMRPALGRRRAGVEPAAGHDLDGGTTAPHGAAAGRGGHRRGQFAGPRSAADGADRPVRLVVGIRTASPDWTLKRIAAIALTLCPGVLSARPMATRV
jgi:DNA invertase Pin-like site-specific DNA recombinase